MNINKIILQKEFYNINKYCVIDSAIDPTYAKNIQKEIL